MNLNTTSTDAMHWAENLVATAKENNFTMEQVLDESWLVGWFANYWAAVYDPLKNEVEQLQAEKQRLMDASIKTLEAMTLYFNQYPHMQKGYTMDAIDELKQALEGGE